MPVIRRPGETTEESPTLTVQLPLPDNVDDQVALISKILRTKNITYMSISSNRISYDFLKGDIDDEIIQWYLNRRSE